MKRKFAIPQVLRGILALLCLAGILAYALWPRLSGKEASFSWSAAATGTPSSAEAEATPSFGDTIRTLLSEISAQEKTDALILSELHTGTYTAEEPLVLDNPYGCSPLTALAVFTTEEPARVSIRVHGKTNDADINNDFPALITEHIIPIYGLYADFLNTVTLTVTTEGGEKTVTSVSIQTDAIDPNTVGTIILQTDIRNAAQMSPGLTFLYSHKLAFDAYGDIRWTNNTLVTPPSTLYNYGNGTSITTFGSYLEGEVLLLERNFLGKFLRVWYSPYGVHHDITQGENGNLLVTGSQGASIEDFVYELNAETGEIIHTLDLKTVLPRSSERINATLTAESALSENWGMSATDWFHLNAIVWDDGDVILSGRHSSAVVKMAWPSGEIKWILASPFGWPTMFQKYLLTPAAGQSDFEWPYWQHAPMLLPDQDNNPNTTDLILFDNGCARFGEADVRSSLLSKDLASIQKYSRLVQYRIDETDHTIRQVWQYGKERGEELYSERCGDADYLPNGNRLGFFYIVNEFPENASSHVVISEVSASGTLIWEALLTAENGVLEAYRGERLPIYGECDQNLLLGQATRVLIPASVLKANGVTLP